MAETAETITTTIVSPPPHPESEDSSTAFPTTTDPTSQEEATDLKKPGGTSLRIWPPSEKTRNGVLTRLIETLSDESILSKRYGTLTSEEAKTVAKSIEEEAYGVASSSVVSDDDGFKILEVYSKEISKRMLESVKARSNGKTEDLKDDDAATSVEEDDKVEA